MAYDENSRGAILALKHADRLELVPGFAGWLARAGQALIAESDMVVPAPLHRSRATPSQGALAFAEAAAAMYWMPSRSLTRSAWPASASCCWMT